jgi:hypothetical protein
MRTSMKVMLAAMGAIVLASPVMAETARAETARAETWRKTRLPPSAAFASWGKTHGPFYGYGPAVRPAMGQPASGAGIRGTQSQMLDCVHLLFPQCGDGG